VLAIFGVCSDATPQSPPAVSGIKMTVRNTFGDISSESTMYFQGDRKRMDFRRSSGGARRPDGSVDLRYGPHIASITRCDLGQMFQLNLDAHEYSSAPYPPNPLTKEQTEAIGIKATPPGELQSKPTLLIETTTVDTGERKQLFGHTARHVIVTRKETPLEGSRRERQESVTDGWYIDLDVRISCDRKWPAGARAYLRALSGDGRAPDVPKFVDVGEPVTGFQVEMKMTNRSTFALPDGTTKENTSTNESSITQLEEGPLAPAIFEIPPGFRQVAHIEQNPPLDWQTVLANDWQWLKAQLRRIFD
jgi:hypothetical protein